jgi:tetratricopeptide (TPR) repeat protein
MALSSGSFGRVAHAAERQSVPFRPLWEGVQMNHGDPYRVPDELVGRLWEENGLVVRYEEKIAADGGASPRGRFAGFQEVSRLLGSVSKISDSFRLYSVDLGGDGFEELMVAPAPPTAAVESGQPRRFFLTVLEMRDGAYRPVRSLNDLTGLGYRVEDVRAVKGDGRRRVLLSADSDDGEDHRKSAVIWHEDGEIRWQEFSGLRVSLAFRSFDDGKSDQLLVTKALGATGIRSDWTYWTDVYSWNGRQYVEANRQFAAAFAHEVVPGFVELLLRSGDLFLKYPDDPNQGVKVLEARADILDRANEIVQSAGLISAQDVGRAREVFMRGRLAIPRKWPVAKQAFQEATELDPWFAEAVLRLGYVYERTGHCEEALSAYRRSLGLNPRLARAWRGMGYCLAKLDDPLAVNAYYNFLTFSQDRKEGRDVLVKKRLVSVGESDRGILAVITEVLRQYPIALFQ